MCPGSRSRDHFNDKWNEPLRQELFTNFNSATKEEAAALRKEVEEMKALLVRAKIYDIEHTEHHKHCSYCGGFSGGETHCSGCGSSTFQYR